MDTIKDGELTRTRLAARVAEQGPPANHSRTQRHVRAAHWQLVHRVLASVT
jgi:hypothetical protein